MRTLHLFFLILFVGLCSSFQGIQDTSGISRRNINVMVTKGDYAGADSLLSGILKKYSNAPDSLIAYIYTLGRIKLHLYDRARAIREVESLGSHCRDLVDQPRSMRQLELELASFYNLLGNWGLAFDLNLKALELTNNMEGAGPEDFGQVYSNLGTLARRKGDIPQAMRMHRKALRYFEKDPDCSAESQFISYNSLGGMMWFASKIDSALLYYHKAEEALTRLDPGPVNRYYRPASLKNNMAGLYRSKGAINRAFIMLESAITDIAHMLKLDIPGIEKEKAYNLYFQSIENLAALYKEEGNLQKSKELLLWSYGQKEKHYDSLHPALFKSKILLGQVYLALRDLQKAEMYLDAGIEQINRIPGDYLFWKGDAHYYLATANDLQGDYQSAAYHFDRAGELYEAGMGGAYDEIYLEFIIFASNFFARYGQSDKALSMAGMAYRYIVDNQGSESIMEFKQLLNIGEIYYELGDYERALSKAKEASASLQSMERKHDHARDSSYFDIQKIPVVLLEVKCNYQLNASDTSLMRNDLNRLEYLLDLLEQKSPFIGSDDFSILLSNNEDVFEWVKILALRLYRNHGEKQYLRKILASHESALYYRIRSKLNGKNELSYYGMPADILKRENELRAGMSTLLQHTSDIEKYISLEREWKNFLNELREEYPDYYQLKYTGINAVPGPRISGLGDSLTLIRYMYIGDSLYALLFNRQGLHFYSLASSRQMNKIDRFHRNMEQFDSLSTLSYQLYQLLWQPLENEVTGSEVIIIPDKALFNLSFELLSFEPLQSAEELAAKTLLAKYAISYNFSTVLLSNRNRYYTENYVAFAPGFTEDMKKAYSRSLEDSFYLDHQWLKLLPQPFTKDLILQFTNTFNGEAYLNNEATRNVFIENASEHKIIHIGTHAESQNLNPEYSRLIFAKDPGPEFESGSNQLFEYELYSCDLSSNLTVLTACESGKPHYAPGEGMISLAHSFHYAGSESTLTALWNVDEESSSIIVSNFFEGLIKGLSKSKALQNAKIEYLHAAEGRMLLPAYWAGLILLGDTAPIEFDKLNSKNKEIPWKVSLTVIVMILLIFLLYRITPPFRAE